MNKFDEVWYSEARIKLKFTKKAESTNSDFVDAVKKVVLSYNIDGTIVLGLSVKETDVEEVKEKRKISNSLTSVTLSLEVANIQKGIEPFLECISETALKSGVIEDVLITEFSGLRTRSLGNAGLQSYSKRFEMARSSAALIINVFKYLVKTLSTEESIDLEEAETDD